MDAEPVYINCGTVVCILLPCVEGLVCIRRGNPQESGYGLLGLIGGFQEGVISERIRVTAVRECQEEVGIQIFQHQLHLINADTDDYRHNVIFFEVEYRDLPTFEDLKAQSRIDPNEVQELVLLTQCPEKDDVAYMFHYFEMRDFFARRRKRERVTFPPQTRQTSEA